MIVVPIHGISIDRPPTWWLEWAPYLVPSCVPPGVQVCPITWEPAEEHRAAADRLLRAIPWYRWFTNFEDLAGDLRAVVDPLTQRLVQYELERAAWQSDGLVVIAHSLGTVLAWQALTELATDVRLFVTIGSPLWMPIWGCEQKPFGVHRWVNVFSPLDFFVGRKPIAAADRNISAFCRHEAVRYLGSAPFRRELPEEFHAALAGEDPAPPAAAIAA